MPMFDRRPGVHSEFHAAPRRVPLHTAPHALLCCVNNTELFTKFDLKFAPLVRRRVPGGDSLATLRSVPQEYSTRATHTYVLIRRTSQSYNA
ncbi:hypothetical protein O3G_MSEX001263 [Manduca sexta]|uniref:Uncharacterized protein n=1 Tax=Manduca sexta TaxID=7130 RepID=A0A922CCE9_MANSE|nr:hypothetical protein O3G_MSEX001263 [Manduca sexta]